MLGDPISPADQRDLPVSVAQPRRAAGRNRHRIATLEALDLTYAIGGSAAAMMYGKPRFTEASNSPPATEQSRTPAHDDADAIAGKSDITARLPSAVRVSARLC